MAFKDVLLRFLGRADEPVKATSRPPRDAEAFSWAPGAGPWMPGGTYVGTYSALAVTRAEALAVPTVLRGRNLICSLASLPLRVHDTDDHTERPSTLFGQIDTSTTNVVTIAQTLDDLIFESVSYWQVTDRYADGRIRHARHIDRAAVHVDPPYGTIVQTLPSGITPGPVSWVSGTRVTPRDIIRFDSPNPPLLAAGARAVRVALKLAQTVEMFADDPEARAYWTSSDGIDPDEDEVRETLNAYTSARRQRAEAYVGGGLKREVTKGTSAVDLQLVQLKQRSDLELANLLGIDPEDVGINTTSRTYANAVDRRIDQVNQTLAPYIKALEQRLSMDDFTPHGTAVTIDLTDFMKVDPSTRWSTYATALDKGVLTVAEIRQREGLPAVPVEPAPDVQTASEAPIVVTFSDDSDDSVIFFDDASFKASRAKRSVSGMLVPYGAVGRNRVGKWRIAEGALKWDAENISRIKLNIDHEMNYIGAAKSLESTPEGVFASFSVSRSSKAGDALADAEDGIYDGLSAEITDVVWEYDDTGTVREVSSAKITGAALTARPAFAPARVTSVAASRHAGDHTSKEPSMPPEAPPTSVPAPVEAFTEAVDAFTAAVKAIPEQYKNALTEAGRLPVGSAIKVREPLVYRLNGTGESFVRDAWTAKKAQFGSKEVDDALARLRKYATQTEELSEAQFANAGNTTDQADIIPPGYRPDLYVGQIPQGRPLFNSIGTRITLANATPFKVPIWVGSADLSGENTEGTGPSTGTITDHDYITVTPTAQSGEFEITRELMDSSNPAIDVIAMNAMREEYGQDTEAVIAAAIAAATDNDTGSGQSTEGCYVYSVTGTGNDLAIDGVREMGADFAAHRFLEPDTLLASPTGFKALAKAIDDIGRPIFPYESQQNAMGTYGRARRTMNVDGFSVPNTWSMTSTYDDLLMYLSTDILVGESGLLTFKFEEKSGPEKIVLNIWGYFAFQILRYTGIHACNYTAA